MAHTYDQWDAIEAASRPGSAFSNGHEWECWSAQWCERCKHDADQDKGGCPLIVFAMSEDKTPAEWVEGVTDEQGRVSLRQRYRCVDFTPRH